MKHNNRTRFFQKHMFNEPLKKCDNCSSYNEEDALYCKNCGAKFETESALEIENELNIKIGGKKYTPYIFIIATILSIMIQVLSSSGNNTSTVIITLYFNIILSAITIYYIKIYGILSVLTSTLIFLLTIKKDLPNILILCGANVAQAIIIYIAFNFIDVKLDDKFEYLSIPKMLMFVLGVVYIILCILLNEYYIIISFVILFLLIVASIIELIQKKNKNIILYVSTIAILPNFLGASLGSIEIVDNAINVSQYFNNFSVWFLSNSILLMSFGYIIFCFLFKIKHRKLNNETKFLEIKFSTVLFFFSIIVWNVIIFVLYFWGWLNNNIYTYVFPWFVGNLFFGLNLFFSTFDENDEKDKSKIFSWYESRSIVAENNTQMLVAILAFLLPICAQMLGTISESIASLFVLNITSAIITIGLIWIPKNNVKYMSTIKHIKTVFHLFTLSLLLLNIVLIINETISKMN